MAGELEIFGKVSSGEISVSGRNHHMYVWIRETPHQDGKRRRSAGLTIETEEQFQELLRILNETWNQPRLPGEP